MTLAVIPPTVRISDTRAAFQAQYAEICLGLDRPVDADDETPIAMTRPWVLELFQEVADCRGKH
jgi:hypothetical protein